MVSAPSLSTDMETSYRVSLARTGEGPDAVWLAELHGFPNCSARGATPDEAVRRVWAAAHELPETRQEPEPATRTPPRHSGKLLVRMPATLHDELARVAETEGVSLNQLITATLAGAVDWRSVDDPPATHAGGRWLSGRSTQIVLAANVVVVVVAAIAAITVLILAWLGGV